MEVEFISGWADGGLGTIPNRAESLRKLIEKLGPAEKLRVLL